MLSTATGCSGRGSLAHGIVDLSGQLNGQFEPLGQGRCVPGLGSLESILQEHARRQRWGD